MKRAVFLDRDGVLNKAIVRDERPYAPTRLEDFEISPGVPDLVADLKKAGLLVVVVTNQPDVARGLVAKSVVEAMHRQLKKSTLVDDIRACYCTEAGDNHCYKPRPGMLLDAARDLNIDLARSYMIGDRWRDVGAGKAAGCLTYFIDYGYNEELQHAPDYIFANFENTVGHILANL